MVLYNLFWIQCAGIRGWGFGSAGTERTIGLDVGYEIFDSALIRDDVKLYFLGLGQKGSSGYGSS